MPVLRPHSSQRPTLRARFLGSSKLGDCTVMFDRPSVICKCDSISSDRQHTTHSTHMYHTLGRVPKDLCVDISCANVSSWPLFLRGRSCCECQRFISRICTLILSTFSCIASRSLRITVEGREHTKGWTYLSQ